MYYMLQYEKGRNDGHNKKKRYEITCKGSYSTISSGQAIIPSVSHNAHGTPNKSFSWKADVTWQGAWGFSFHGNPTNLLNYGWIHDTWPSFRALINSYESTDQRPVPI